MPQSVASLTPPCHEFTPRTIVARTAVIQVVSCRLRIHEHTTYGIQGCRSEHVAVQTQRTSAAAVIALLSHPESTHGQASALQLIDAGGHRLETLIKGKGRPAVVFDAGVLGGMSGWRVAQDSGIHIIEGAGVNHGWADYRDHHLGPELETVRELRASQLRGRAQVCAWQR